MSYLCPQCGAAFDTDETCQARFDLSQLMELEQPARYAVHHLSVPCYMLQHNAYSRTGWIEVRTLLAKFIDAGWTPAMARREVRAHADSRQRTWSFTRGPKLPGVEQIRWSRTIAAVRLTSPEEYCSDVWAWAVSILTDSAALMAGLDERPAS